MERGDKVVIGCIGLIGRGGRVDRVVSYGWNSKKKRAEKHAGGQTDILVSLNTFYGNFEKNIYCFYVIPQINSLSLYKSFL